MGESLGGKKDFPLVLARVEDWRRFLDSSPWPLLICDEKGGVLLASEDLSAYFGEEIKGKHLEDFDLPSLLPQTPRLVFKSEKGHLFKISYHLLRDEKGKTKGALLYFEDLEEILEEARRKAFPAYQEGALVLSPKDLERGYLLWQALETLKGPFSESSLIQKEKLEALEILARGLAHDFRNFLSAVEGNLELAKRAKDPREKEHFLSRAQRALHRAREFAEGLLRGRPEKPYDLERLLRETAELLLAGTHVKWTVVVPREIWCPRMDRVQLTQILLNLIANACEAMAGDGELIIEAENLYWREEGPVKPGPYVRLRIQDTGPGIPPEVLPRIFDPAFSSKGRGHGFGLAMVYSIVRAHGGSIEVESRPGEGTTFTLLLPARKGKEEVLVLEEEVEEETEVCFLIPPLQRVLVIDDDPELLSVFSEMLKLLGYEVCAEKDPHKAVSLYEKALKEGDPFDLVILDYDLPKTSGLKILTLLKEIHPEARVIIATGYQDPEIIEALKRSGAHAFLRKPFRLKDLAAVL